MNWIEENWLRVLLAITSTGTLTIAVRFYAIWRKGRTDDRTLEIGEDGKLRDHYAAELVSLREQITKSGDAHAARAKAADERYQAAMQAADTRFDAAMKAADEREAQCQVEVRKLREEVLALSTEVIGLRRELAQSAKSAIILATHAPSIGIQESADRAVQAMDDFDARQTRDQA